MKTGKRIVSILLVALLLLTAAPLAGFVGLEIFPQAKALDATGQCGDNVYWSFDESTGALTISGTGKMWEYYSFTSSSPINNNSRVIKTLTINSGVTSISYNAFSACSNLTNVTIGDSVSDIELKAFFNCSSLTRVSVDENNQNYSSDENGCLYNKEKTVLIQYPIGNTRASFSIPNSVMDIYENAFSYCDNLVSIEIPDSVVTIGYYTFAGCTSLKSLTIPNSDALIGGCAFENCCSLTSIEIPDNVMNIKDYTFARCTSLKNVTIPDSVGSIGYGAFGSCRGLTSVTIPDSVGSIGEYAFSDCISLTSVKIGNSVTSIGDDAFSCCTSLTSLTIPDSVESIGKYAFSDCISLTSVKIGNSVTSIGRSAFSWCTSLTSVTIPDSVTSIDWHAFEGCSNLKDVYYTGTQQQWEQISIGSNNECLTNATIHYNSSGEQPTEVPVESIQLDQEHLFLRLGTSVTLKATIEPENASSAILWESSDTSVATVDESGSVTPKGIGTAVITATTIDGNHKALCYITVSRRSFVIGVDNNSFIHNPDSFFKPLENIPILNVGKYYIDSDMFNCFINGYKTHSSKSNNEKKTAIDTITKKRDSKWGGSCFGLSSTMALTYSEMLDLSNFVSGEEYYYFAEEPKENTRFRSLINIYHLSQYLPDIENKAYAKFSDKAELKSTLNMIVTKATNTENYAEPFLFSMRYKWGSNIFNKGSAGHAIICLGCEKKPDGYRLKFADPNKRDDFIYANVPNDYSDIAFETNYNAADQSKHSRSNWSLAAISYRDLDDFEFIDLDGPYNENSFLKSPKNKAPEEAKTTLIFDSNMNFELESSNGEVITFDGADVSGSTDDIEIDYAFKGEESLDYIIKINKNDNYKVVCQNDTVDFSIYDDDANYYAVSGTSVDSIDIDMDHSVKVTGDDIDCNLYIGVNNDEYDLMRFTCEDSHDICATISDNTVNITSSNVNDIDSVVFKDGEESTIDLEIKNGVGVFNLASETSHTHTYTAAVTTEPTCTADGETTYTCSVCGDTYTEPIPATGEHADADNDGYCDACEEMMTGGQHCKYCGKIHGGLFGWLVKIFHSIFVIFKR